MTEFVKKTEAMTAAWHGIAAPNEPARRMTAELEGLITAFEAVRGTLRFEDEPSSFEQALLDLAEQDDAGTRA